MQFSSRITVLIAALASIFVQTQARAERAPADAPVACTTCAWPIAPQASEAGMAGICDDLFGAACLDEQGRNRYAAENSVRDTQNWSSIAGARDVTARAMGFANFGEAFKARLRSEGIELREPVSTAALDGLMGATDSLSAMSLNNISGVFAASAQCVQEYNELPFAAIYQVPPTSTLAEVSANIARMETFISKNRELSIKLHAKDLPGFINTFLPAQCEKLVGSKYYIPESEELSRICAASSQLRRTAIELFRQEGSPGYQAAVEKLVRENMPPRSIEMPSGGMMGGGVVGGGSMASQGGVGGVMPMPTPSELDVARGRLFSLSMGLDKDCETLHAQLRSTSKNIFKEFAPEINRAKTTIDALLSSVYTPARRQLATRLFDSARADVRDIVNESVSNPVKRDHALAGYDSMTFKILERPPNSDYIPNSSGRLVLDAERGSPRGDGVYDAFSDPALSYFTTQNANYMPGGLVGEFRVEQRVNIMPSLWTELDTNPYGFLAVLAHETGHRMGPQMSRLNGHDMRAEYREALTCLSSPASIRMQQDQGDESIADMISAEVLARQISRLPVERRRTALLSSMGLYCSLEALGDSSLSCKSEHPDLSLRIGGIFGANPRVRAAIGCAGDSPKFRTCGLNLRASTEISNDSGAVRTENERATSGGSAQ